MSTGKDRLGSPFNDGEGCWDAAEVSDAGDEASRRNSSDSNVSIECEDVLRGRGWSSEDAGSRREQKALSSVGKGRSLVLADGRCWMVRKLLGET
ncbi:hypothetical protein JAAARDRAFT_41883 [Jaapia argillacea MUCL 33604]|uniref:Uncharacterized protein n=1 Tax=Jaapia argillacea MUCL 33604 TaxID=933084 RepID=A0A067P9S2_9AGAM|nr:hypothetical protein JAAARDRAFT_41883 [Jaapia argillacea MUCL 33604]